MMGVVILNTINDNENLDHFNNKKTSVDALNTKAKNCINCIVNSIVERYDPSKLILTPHFPPQSPRLQGKCCNI